MDIEFLQQKAVMLKNHAWLERFRRADYENKYNELSPQACRDIAAYVDSLLDDIICEPSKAKE